MKTQRSLYMTAKEAAAELSVSLPTLYAYVSRGLIQSEPVPDSRAKRYRAEDVRALKQRRRLHGGASGTGVGGGTGGGGGELGPALSWGAPVLDSAITLIAEGRLYYRGSDAAELARSASLEHVATLIWDCQSSDPFAEQRAAARGGALPGAFAQAARAVAELSPTDRCLALLPVAGAADRGAYNRTPAGMAATGARILRLMAAIVAGNAAEAASGDALSAALGNRNPASAPIHEQLAQRWTPGVPAAAPLIRAALVLCADHELNASAFTARCVTSTGAHLYNAVIAGLCALQGPRHGAISGRVTQFLGELARLDGDDDALDRHLMAKVRSGERLPGFGHALYPDGDPRARCLLELIDLHLGAHEFLNRLHRIIDTVNDATGLQPNIDFTLGACAHMLALPDDAGLSLFAVGRTVGWIGHAMEQSHSSSIIRPRARYVGVAP